MHTWYTAARTRCTHNWKVKEENNPSHGDVWMNHSNKLCHEVPRTEHAFICILVAYRINIAIFLKIQTDSLPQKVARSFPLARGWAETESFISTAFYSVKWLRARVFNTSQCDPEELYLNTLQFCAESQTRGRKNILILAVPLHNEQTTILPPVISSFPLEDKHKISDWKLCNISRKKQNMKV